MKTPESMAIEVVRLLMLASQGPNIAQVTVTVATEVANYINNRKRRELSQLEEEDKITVQVLGAKGVRPNTSTSNASTATAGKCPFPRRATGGSRGSGMLNAFGPPLPPGEGWGEGEQEKTLTRAIVPNARVFRTFKPGRVRPVCRDIGSAAFGQGDG